MAVVCLGILAAQLDGWGQIRRRDVENVSGTSSETLKEFTGQYCECQMPTAVNVTWMKLKTHARLQGRFPYAVTCSHFASAAF